MASQWISTTELIELTGTSEATIWRKTKAGEWVSRAGAAEGRGRPRKEILVSSLPPALQAKCLTLDSIPEPEISIEEDQTPPDPMPSNVDRLAQALKRYPAEERDAWIAELNRLANIVQRYIQINPKRARNPLTIKHEFVSAVIDLCKEATSTNEIIVSRESSMGKPPSPYTLDRWSRDLQKHGLVAFIRVIPQSGDHTAESKRDRRKAQISNDAIEWINSQWRSYRSPRALYEALKAKAKKQGWQIPNERWLYRKWNDLPDPVITYHLKGKKAYTDRFAPYVPRDYSDLEALQILVGDHSERDITVLLKNGSIARPWLTLWQDLRTGLIWGWHLDLVPSSYTAGLAYADGVMNFGAQPLARPDENFYSYVYTDQGKDYRSHNWDGRSITVHKHAMRLDGGIEVLRVERQVGFLDELGIKHLLARGYNAREKMVERTHRDISDWEENHFEEYCGRDAKSRPDRWRELYAQHLKFEKGKRSQSPFIGIEEYRDALRHFIHQYNTSEHQRTTLAGARIVPLEEYRQLYVAKYGRVEIAEESLALLLMKAEKRLIRKNGVQCFQKTWYYYHPAMAEFKGKDVEVRYSDGDYSRVFVFLPNGQICEAALITPSGVLSPNKQTMGMIAEARARENKLLREHNLLTTSIIRGESTEDRVAEILEDELEENEAIAAEAGAPARIQRITRMDRTKLRAVPTGPRSVTREEVARIRPDESIFSVADEGRIKEFDDED